MKPFIGQKVWFRIRESERRIGTPPTLRPAIIAWAGNHNFVNIGYLNESGAWCNKEDVNYVQPGQKACYDGGWCSAEERTTNGEEIVVNEKATPADEQLEGNNAPEPHKIGPGDTVQLKGGIGPKMTVSGWDQERGGDYWECVYWDTTRADCNRFESIFVHRDSLAYFAPPSPTTTFAEIAEEEGRGSVQQNSNTGSGCQTAPKLPKTAGVALLREAIKTGIPLAEKLGAQVDDYRVHGALKILAKEVEAHVDLT